MEETLITQATEYGLLVAILIAAVIWFWRDKREATKREIAERERLEARYNELIEDNIRYHEEQKDQLMRMTNERDKEFIAVQAAHSKALAELTTCMREFKQFLELTYPKS